MFVRQTRYHDTPGSVSQKHIEIVPQLSLHYSPIEHPPLLQMFLLAGGNKYQTRLMLTST